MRDRFNPGARAAAPRYCTGVPNWVPAVLVVLVAAGVVAALDLGRRGRQGPRPDDAHWFGGVFYVNRADRRIVVPKRYGLGYGRTLNFGHPVAWLVVAVPLLIAIAGAAGRHG